MKNDIRKIILITGGDGGYGNLGDEWLLDAVKSRYHGRFGDYRIIILKLRPPKFHLDRFEYVHDSPEGLDKAEINIDKIAFVHFYGGGYINSMWMQDKLWLYDHLIARGYPAKQIFFTGLGTGPLNKKDLTKVKVISNNCAFFGTRDKEFYKEVNPSFMFDETIFFYKSFPKRKPTDLLINIRITKHVGVDEKKLAILLKDINKLATNRGLNVKYFPMIENVWFNEGNELEKLLRKNNINSAVLKRPKNYKQLLSLYSNAAMVVTTSYHATLSALYLGIPVVAVYENEYYRHKYSGLEGVLKTELLNILELKKDSMLPALYRTLQSKDEQIEYKLKILKEINEECYRTIWDRVDIKV